MRRSVFAGVLTGALVLAGAALAAPVTWNVNGTWDDGGGVTGSFTYDADTNTYSAISIGTVGGALPPATYVATNGVFFGPTQLIVVTAAGTGAGERVAAFTFSAPLTNAGGSVLLGPTTGEGTCNAGCVNYAGGVADRLIVGGVVTTAVPAVPTLGEWAMIGLMTALAGLGGMIAVQRRRRLA